jgi:hypothetical protein
VHVPRTTALLLAAGLAVPWAQTTLEFTIDRSGLPPLTYYDLTLKVDACGASSAAVEADGQTVPSELSDGYVVFTTDADNVTVSLTGATNTANLGDFEKAVLKYDRLWAWSNGFDDNTGFESTAMPVLEQYGYRATVFLIGNIIDDTRDEDWIIDKVDIMRLVQEGWGIGNHTWDHSAVPCYRSACTWGTPEHEPNAEELADAKAVVVQLHDYLRAACDEAGRSDYKLIAFAAPLFDSRWQPVIDAIRGDGDTEILFNESGNSCYLVVDPDWVDDDVWSGPSPFDPYGSIGRDWAVEAFNDGGDYDPKSYIMSEIAKCGPDRHFWYNSLCHGVGSDHGVMEFIPWVYNNYGEGGDNSVWVAPSDEIYSYLLVRDNAVVTYDGGTWGAQRFSRAPVAEAARCRVDRGAVTVTAAGAATVSLVNTLGREIVRTRLGAGEAAVLASNLSRGVYHLRLDTAGSTTASRVVAR